MEIFWITTRHHPDRGGMAQSSTRIAAALRERGHRVTVLHLGGSGIPDPACQHLTVAPGRSWSDDPGMLFWQNRGKMEKSVIVGFGGNIAGYLAVLWSRWLRARSVVLFRGNDFDTAVHDPRRAWMVQYILDNASCVGAVSTEMKTRISCMRRGPVVFSPNSLDAHEWDFLDDDMADALRWKSENLPSPKPLVAMFGELKLKKGFDTAYSLFSSYRFSDRAWLLTVGELGDHIRENYRREDAGFWLHVPFVEREDLHPLYAASDVVFIPSYYDGMPNVLLEAMALGRIVAAARSGGMPDVIDHGTNGLLFDPLDLDDAASVLDRALTLSGEERDRMSGEARRTIRESYHPGVETSVIEGMILSGGSDMN